MYKFLGRNTEMDVVIDNLSYIFAMSVNLFRKRLSTTSREQRSVCWMSESSSRETLSEFHKLYMMTGLMQQRVDSSKSSQVFSIKQFCSRDDLLMGLYRLTRDQSCKGQIAN